MAEVLLQRRISDRSGAAEVSSAGLLDGGAPATDLAIETMAAEGLDLTAHCSRRVTTSLLDQSDLVITMTRQHLIELTLMAPDSWPRIFQLVDLVRRAELVGPRRPEQPFGAWLEVVGEGRTRAGMLASSLSDDVADPVGQSAAVYKRTREHLDDLLTRLAALL